MKMQEMKLDDDDEAWDENENEAEQWVDISTLPVKCVAAEQLTINLQQQVAQQREQQQS